MTAITIRIAQPDDNRLLAELGAETFSDSFALDNTPEDMQAYLAQSFSPELQAAELAEPGSIFLIAEAGGQTAGYARLLEAPVPPGVTGERPLELVRIYARKAWIGHGVGSTLMQACLDEAARGGYDTLWLGVWERNPRAIAFYQRWGFETVARQPFRLGGELQTDLVMQRSV